MLSDTIADVLWINGYSSYNGTNDRIPEDSANTLRNSLVLVQPEELTVIVNIEGAEFNNSKRKVRASFRLNNHEYKLAVTDPKIEKTYLKKANGTYKIKADRAYLCISIGEPYDGFCYKLIASIITPN